LGEGCEGEKVDGAVRRIENRKKNRERGGGVSNKRRGKITREGCGYRRE